MHVRPDPPTSANALAKRDCQRWWLAGPALFFVSLAGLVAVQRRSKRNETIDQLTEDEEKEIEKLLSS